MSVFLSKLENNTAISSNLQSVFKSARLAYKQAEFLTEYKAPVFAKLINGPPVPEVEEEDNQELITNPEGFQVIETFIYPEYDRKNLDTLVVLTKDLLKSVRLLKQQMSAESLTDSMLFKALRKEVFRITTLGITTYDADLSGNALAETAAAMTAIRTIVSLYQWKAKFKSKSLFQQFDQLVSQGIVYINNNCNDTTFNRMVFIITYANPISGFLSKIAESLNIAMSEDMQVVNPAAENLFAANAFNQLHFVFNKEDFPNKAKKRLGQLLFFDPVLSANRQRSCASCHRPEMAFTDGVPKSLALNGVNTVRRNTPTLLNAGLQPAFFYDSRATYLEDQINDVISSVDEMHSSVSAAVAVLRNSPEYIMLFKDAFPESNNPLTPYHLQNAIATYIRSLTKLNSPFDKYMRGDYSLLNARQVNGFNLFMGKAKCGTCHFAPLFNGALPPDFSIAEKEVLGVPSKQGEATIDSDKGRYELHPASPNLHAFRTPTLRNIALTAPYMHNGIYYSLKQVIDFYNKGGGYGLGIKLDNQTLSEKPLNLNDREIDDIISFLRTLTDTTGSLDVPQSLPKLTVKDPKRSIKDFF